MAAWTVACLTAGTCASSTRSCKRHQWMDQNYTLETLGGEEWDNVAFS